MKWIATKRIFKFQFFLQQQIGILRGNFCFEISHRLEASGDWLVMPDAFEIISKYDFIFAKLIGLYHPLDGITNLKYKLLGFLTPNKKISTSF
jgi:hypothetical protein